jgi:hypothetical protein
MVINRGNLSRKDYTDYEFIVQEVGRLIELSPEQLLKYYSEHKDDALSTLWGPDGRTLPCTRAGWQRFDQIVTRGLNALGANARTHAPSTLRSALMGKFVAEAQKIVADTTQENAHEIFEHVVRAVEEEYKELTHYVPCSVVAHKKPERFTIGPVGFVLREMFMRENESALRAALTSSPASGWQFRELESFFSRFQWVAFVRILACDESISTVQARRVVQRALDLFKLFIGSERAANVKQGYDLSIPGTSSTLVSSEPGAFSLTHSRRLRDAIVIDDWYSQLSGVQQWRTAEGIVSASWQNWDNVGEPFQRFLDSLSWHGDAIAEPDAQARILKFWTAIERVVSLKNGDPVTRRAAVMSVADLADFAKRFQQCQKLYSIRSNILHGTQPYHAAGSVEAAFQAERLSQLVLLGYLRMLNVLEKKAAVTRDGLHTALHGLDKISRDAPTGERKRSLDQRRDH